MVRAPAVALLLAAVGAQAALVPAHHAASSIRRPIFRSSHAMYPHTLRVRGGMVRGGDDVTMSAAVIVERLCPALGFVLSSWLYYSPLPKLRSCVRKGTLGAFNPLPSALMVIGTTAWLGYGLSVKDPWITATNVPGTLIAVAQLVIMLPVMGCDGRDACDPRPLKQLQATVLGGTVCTVLLWVRLIFGGVSASARSHALGVYATAICILLFASPLSTIASVFRTRNAASILAPLTAAQCANCLMWSTYGVFAARDIFVWGPNGAGLLLGLLQLGLKMSFPSDEDVWVSEGNDVPEAEPVTQP